MSPERWRRIQELFEACVALQGVARGDFLASLEEEDRAEVRSLLAHAERPGVLDDMSESVVGPLREVLQRDPFEGRRIGAFRVVRKLGEGGMGVVYLGERADGQFDQRVALKIVRSGFHAGPWRERFLEERRLLARLEHPNIARLIDGGFLEDGTPYYAMEYVAGEPIDAYCTAHALSVRARCALFVTVAEAVQHAHQNLIVHRDLKPSNIYVTADGVVKLLDFGIARAFDPDSQDGEAPTRSLGRLMTPAYASPEQVRGESVTTATDTYALGVILYELLTRRRPYHIQPTASPSEVERIVATEIPPKPSEAVVLGTPSPEGATRSLINTLQGDLDTILLKALAKEPFQRYGTAGALADDLRRFLDGRPVHARPATAWYRFSRLVRRHRAGFVVSLVLLITVILGGLGMYWQSRRVLAERDIARAERDRTEQVAALMQQIFRLPDPGQALGDTVTARRLLDEGVARIRLDLQNQPELQAILFGEIGQVYQNLGLFAESEPLFEEAVAIERKLHPTPHPDLARTLHLLGSLRGEMARYDEAESLLQEALGLRERLLDKDHLDLAATRYHLAEVLSSLGRYQEAEPLFRLALGTQQARLEAANPAVRATMDGFATLLHRKGDFEQAEIFFREAVDYSRRTSGERHPATLDFVRDLGRLVHRFQMDYPAAESLYLEALDLARDLYGSQHAETAVALNDLAQLSRDRGDLDAAERYARLSLEVWQTAVGDEHTETAVSKFTLASILDLQKKPAEAERLLTEALATERRLLGDVHIRVINTTQQLAWLYLDMRALPRAESLFVASARATEALFGANHAYYIRALQGRGEIRCLEGRLPEGIDLMREALQKREVMHEAGHWRIAQAQSVLAGCLIEAGQIEEARQLLDASLPVLVERLGEADPVTRGTRARMERLGRVQLP